MTTYCYPYRRGTGWRSQAFRSNPGGHNPAGGHTGYDQAMPAGTPIYSPCDGIIRNSGWLSDNYLANDWWLTAMGGDTLVIDAMDANGRTETMPTFIIAHLSDSTAPVGKRVRKGELIGISGNSGTATTGPHAHIEALPPGWDWNNGVYGRVDPELYFSEWPEDLAINAQAAAVKPAPKPAPAPVKDDDMPTYKRVPAIIRKPGATRLAKDKTWYLKDKTGKRNLNLSPVAGLYDVDLFLQGTGLGEGQALTVQFIVVTVGGRRSGYYTQQVHGTKTGAFRGSARFSAPVPKGAFLEVAVTASTTGPDLTTYGADIKLWQ